MLLQHPAHACRRARPCARPACCGRRAAQTLERSYLLRLHGKVVERPQHMLMRVAIGIHGSDVDAAVATYHLLSERWFTHASPTLFNAGTPRPQLSSCFLVCSKGDSIEGIYDSLKECAVISKSAGGIGISIHNIRATGSYIRGTNGTSNGIVPMLRVFNDTARYVDQVRGAHCWWRRRRQLLLAGWLCCCRRVAHQLCRRGCWLDAAPAPRSLLVARL